MPPSPANFGGIFFFSETGFHHVAQAGLELQDSNDLPASASPCAGIISICHCAQPIFGLLSLAAFT